MFHLDGKTALIAGSARGLGKEIAIGLGQNGASLVLADIVPPEKTKKEIEDKGVRCITIQTDISDEAQVKRIADIAALEYGKVDMLVNNAGISQ